ncbi:MAG: acetolactate synthase-1/2/3 large subunit [Gammaproteobacteria bacterium]
MAKWVVEIPEADRIPELVGRAWSTALSGRAGPVVVALPEEVLSNMSTQAPCQPVRIPEPGANSVAMEQAKALISHSKKPLLLVGGRGWGETGKQDLLAFAERTQIPIAVAFRFHDVVDNTHNNYVGDAGVGMSPYLKTVIKDSDLIIAIGVRFGEMTTDGYDLIDVPNPQMKLIHSHSSDVELGKIFAADVPLHCGPNEMTKALANLKLSPKTNSWVTAARRCYLDGLLPVAQPGPVDMGQIMQFLQRTLPSDAILTNGAGNFAIWLNKFFQFGRDQRLLAPQSGAMGFGLPAAIASKAVDGNRTVVCIAGDGDFQMNCQELGTAMQYGIQPIVLIVNNGSYGTIRMHQERHFPARVSGTELINPDFVQIAQGYGFMGEVVKSTDEFYPAFERAMTSKTGAIIDIHIDIESLTPKQSLSAIRRQGESDLAS